MKINYSQAEKSLSYKKPCFLALIGFQKKKKEKQHKQKKKKLLKQSVIFKTNQC